MKERPIFMKGELVRALLDGSKTQTRRIVKPQPYDLTYMAEEGVRRNFATLCPYGQPGDRLWGRETWRGVVKISPPHAVMPEYGVARYVPDQEHCERIEYAATQERDGEPWRPSIHMPRWASRILLEIVSVRVEQLKDISESDARAEGVIIEECHMNGYCAGEFLPPAVRAFRDLWQSLNGAGNWEANPFVWAIEFKRVTP